MPPEGQNKPKAKGGGKQTVAQIISEIAKQYGIPPAVALAMGEQESGLSPTAVGDGGTSFGIYQLHEGGELGSHSEAWAENVRNNAETALRVVAEVHKQNPGADWGWITAHAQRPADESGYAASVNSILAGFHNSGGGDPVTYFENNARAGATLATDQGGGSGGLGGNFTAASVSPGDIKAGLSQLGFASALIHSNKSLTRAFHDIIAKNIDLNTSAGQSRAKSILQNTAWFQNHSKAQRSFDELKYSDPKEFESQLAAQRASLKTAAGTAGIDLSQDQLDHIAQSSLRNGMNTDQVNQLLAHQFSYEKGQSYTGTAGTSIADIQKLAQDYYVPVSNGQMQKYVRQSIAGELDPTTLQQRFQQNAVSMFPYLQQQLQSGQTVADIADPYKQMMSSTLELDANGIKNNNPTIMKALQAKDSNGNMGLQPLWQFQQNLMDDPRWMQTQNAHNSLVDAAGGLLSKMGVMD